MLLEKYERCIDCGVLKTTYHQQRSPRCNACSGKHKREYETEEYYSACIDCGEPKLTAQSKRYPRCHKCSVEHKRKNELFDICQKCGQPKTRNKSKKCRSCSSIKRWETPKYREKVKKAARLTRSSEEYREQSRQRAIAQWQDPEIRERNVNGIKQGWQNEERRRAISERQIKLADERGRIYAIYDHCQTCGKKKPKNNRKLCLSCAGIKRMVEMYPNTDREYPYGWSDNFREAIRDRDHHCCVLCGKAEVDNHKKLHVHHTTYEKADLDPARLVSLCTRCHNKTNWNRPYWQTYFFMRTRQPLQDWQHRAIMSSGGWTPISSF